MAKTWENLISEARETLQDSREPYRYSDAILLNLLNQGLQELGRIRPDAFYDRFLTNDIVVPEVVSVDAVPDTDPDTIVLDEDSQVALTDEFTDDLNMQFYMPLLYFIIGRAELIEDEFASDGRAMAMLGQFKSSVLGL